MANNQINKEAKNQTPKQIPKYYYDVKVECMLPATLTYRILAEDPQQAVELIKGKQPNTVHHKLTGRKELKLSVYEAGSCIVKLVKRLLG